ncbi:glycosyltransferase [Polynucleobacter yangtzensis]|uniref:Glycosyltransferase 2-like domain-containing protein n=1 Tax=Polynucleobacter yangtzensis TaxID=1743159 RepID=A0ABN6TPG5_9BURK|nr:glycosyltransferase [Polynucleobacter yangtzensis]BDT78441.1 hypothetical protein PKF032_03290 [Polynucleobacter yangtzensis]
MKNVPKDRNVTVVITSCNRPNELERTIKSFLLMNTFPVNKYIVIEDGGSSNAISVAKNLLGEEGNVFIKNEKNLGQLNSIDIAYREVESEFIFHMEDDWNFHAPGFIEKSMEILLQEKNVIYLSLRAKTDQNGHPYIMRSDSIAEPLPFWKGVWVGYGFNPSLRRRSDYIMIGSSYGKWNERETSIGIFYYINNKRVLLLADDESYVTHSGNNSSTELTHKKA